MKHYWTAYADENLSASQSSIYICLCTHQGKNDDCFPSHKTIAKETHYSVSTVKRAISKLIEMGYIAKTNQFRENGAMSSNRYKCLK